MKKDFDKRLNEAIKVASKHQMELMQYPGVLSIGVGPKRKKGKIVADVGIVVTVKEKLSDEKLKQLNQKKLPEKLDGIEVDIIQQGKPLEDKKIIAAQKKAKTAISDIKEEWLGKDNVVAIGYGYKIKENQTDYNTIAVKFFVERKLKEEELKKENIKAIPKQIKGVVTDVIQMSKVRPSASSGSRGDRFDPLTGGISVGVGTRPFHYGTYGATVFDRSSGEQLVLSNQHVLDANSGTDTIQPSPVGLDDSVEVGFQLDICNPLHFIRLDTPNTTLGTVLAGGAVAAALAAALSDVIDPTRRGQQVTMPPASAKTLSEHQHVSLDYPEFPIAGTPYAIKTGWEYKRVTDMGSQSHKVEEVNKNPHVLADKLLITDKNRYHPGDKINLYGLIMPLLCLPDNPSANDLTANDIEQLSHFESKKMVSFDIKDIYEHKEEIGHEKNLKEAATNPRACHCDYHSVAILTPTSQDKAYPVVLKPALSHEKGEILKTVIGLIHQSEDEALLKRFYLLARYGCLYKGQLTVSNLPLGAWKHYFYVQTVNNTPQGLNPLIAAQIIGGLPVSQNAKADLDVGCGPFVFEDGSFDIELI